MIAIVATDEKNGIGRNNQLLCHLPDDLKHFKNLTTNHIVIMGRKTFDSIGKPLSNRINVVLSRDRNWKASGIEVVNDVNAILKDLPHQYPDKKMIVIGGAQVYKLFLPHTTEIHRTLIHHSFEADAFFPAFENIFELVDSVFHPKDERHLYDFEIQLWKRKN